jgi:hypothetical protein
MSEMTKQTESTSPSKIQTSQTKITGKRKQTKKGAMAGTKPVSENPKLAESPSKNVIKDNISLSPSKSKHLQN